MKTYCALLVLIVLQLVAGHTLIAQSVHADSIRKAGIQYATAIYRSHMQNDAQLYNGRKYIAFIASESGHQFFKTKIPESATILYDGVVYPNQYALYDAYHDELVLSHTSSQGLLRNIQLYKKRVSQFVLDGHSFIYLNEENNPTAPAPGYYELLYASNSVMVLAKRYKKKLELIEDQKLRYRFTEVNSYYVQVNNTYYPVQSKASVLNVFKEHKPELQRNLRKSELRPYRKNREQVIVTLARRYTELSSQP